MKQKNIQREKEFVEEDEIDLREILHLLLQYKRSILFFMFLFAVSAAYIAYFKPSVYEAQMLLKITHERQGEYEDFLMVSPDGGNSDVEDELVVFESRPIAQKALKKLNIGTRYFTKKKLRIQELYRNAPFTVTYRLLSSKLYGRKFHLIPIDEKSFRLELLQQQSWKQILFYDEETTPIVYNKIHHYGEMIETEWFTLQVNRVYNLKETEYWFTIMPNEEMTDFVQGGVSASLLTKYGSVVSLEYADTVPERAAEIVNSIAEAYIEKNLEYKSEGAKKQLYFIDMQLENINKTLQGSAAKLQKYKATNIVVDLSRKAQMTASKLSDLETDLYETNTQLDVIENMLGQLKKHRQVTGMNIDYIAGNNQPLNRLLSQIQQVKTQYASLSVNYTDKHPGIIRLKRELSVLKHSLRNLLQSSIGTLKKKKENLLQAIEYQQRLLKDVPMQEKQLEQLTRHFMVNEKIYSYLLEKRAETAILASSTISNTRIIEKALPPDFPVKPKRKLIVLVGMILGLIFGIVQAFLRSYFDNTVKKGDDIEKLADTALYGVLPLIKNKKNIPAYLEGIRSLWINLAFSGTQNSSTVIALTSTISGEGKSFTAYHLGRMIAKSSEHRVIVLDMDMRKPTLHHKFDMPNSSSGISTFLSGQRTLEEVIQPTKYTNLDMIASGPIAPNPTRLIMSESFNNMLEVLRQSYDYILLDTSPVGIVSDAMKIMHFSDIVLFLVKADYSKKEFLKEIDRLTVQENLNIGIVLNGVDYEKSYYYYGYRHKHADTYYHHEHEEEQ